MLYPPPPLLLRTIFAVAFVFLVAALPCQAEEGLFAIFQTNRGSFTARLDYEKAPTTVANFVGLVEGTRGWLDVTTGALRRDPFYSGLTFHRVIPGFMIQTGSPNGQSTDGPGYSFGDEFHPLLRHNAAGILAMANSGANSNGSQFFITLAPTSWLDNKHAVFGQIVSGMDIVNAIGAVPTPVQAPETVTTIESITISRVGVAAQAFNALGQWGLPELADAKPSLVINSENFLLRFARAPFSQYFCSLSDDLTTWILDSVLSDLASAPAADIDVTATALGKNKQFYQVVKVGYPQQPSTLLNKTLALHLISSNETLDFAITGEPRGVFDANIPLGTVALNGMAFGNIGAYITGAETNNHAFIVAGDQLLALRFSLKFRTSTQGWFTAQNYSATDGFWPYFGTFEIQSTP